MVLYIKQTHKCRKQTFFCFERGKGVGVGGINYKYKNDRYKLLYIK